MSSPDERLETWCEQAEEASKPEVYDDMATNWWKRHMKLRAAAYRKIIAYYKSDLVEYQSSAPDDEGGTLSYWQGRADAGAEAIGELAAALNPEQAP